MLKENRPGYESLKRQLTSRIAVSEEELAAFYEAFQLIKIKKRQIIVQPEFVAKRRYYVVNGCLKAYVIDDRGDEHTIQFAIDDWWITDYNSYIFQQPASMFVVALEDSTVLQISYEDEQLLKKNLHSYETFFRILAEHTAAYMARRVITGLTQSAEERYRNFLAKYPLIVQRVPQYALASFLGMTTEYLSKLRSKKVTTKS